MVFLRGWLLVPIVKFVVPLEKPFLFFGVRVVCELKAKGLPFLDRGSVVALPVEDGWSCSMSLLRQLYEWLLHLCCSFVVLV